MVKSRGKKPRTVGAVRILCAGGGRRTSICAKTFLHICNDSRDLVIVGARRKRTAAESRGKLGTAARCADLDRGLHMHIPADGHPGRSYD